MSRGITELDVNLLTIDVEEYIFLADSPTWNQVKDSVKLQNPTLFDMVEKQKSQASVIKMLIENLEVDNQ